jgi:hypothetical protein
MQKFTIDTLIFGIESNNNSIYRDEKTLGYIFSNTGNCPVQLNNIILNAGDTFKTFEPLCQDMTKYKCLFSKRNLNDNAIQDCIDNSAQLTIIIYSNAN